METVELKNTIIRSNTDRTGFSADAEDGGEDPSRQHSGNYQI